MHLEPPVEYPYIPDQAWDEFCANGALPYENEALEQAQEEILAEEAQDTKNAEVHHIHALNAFLSQSIGEFLQNQLQGKEYEQFKEELEKQLGPCTTILSPPDYLQFLRQLGQKLTSSKDFFEISYETNPWHLPIPISLSWIANNPVRITVPNPALRTLLSHQFAPQEHTLFYNALIEHVIKTLLIDSPDQLEATHEILFRQLHLEYQLSLNLLQIIFLFFPHIFVTVANQHPEHDFAALLDEIFLEHGFGISDAPLKGTNSCSTPLIESLIVGDQLATFPLQLLNDPTLREKVCSYLTLLVRHGITESKAQLADPIVLSIAKVAGKIFETSRDLVKEAPLYNYLYDALTIVKSRNSELAKKIQAIPFFQKHDPLTPHVTYQKFTANKAIYFPSVPEQSFLLVDLLGICQSHKRKELALSLPPNKVRKTENHKAPTAKPSLTTQIWNLNHTFSKSFLQHLPSLQRFLEGKEEVVQLEWLLDRRNLLGSALLQAFLHRKSGLHLVVVPDSIRFEILDASFYQAIFSIWKLSTLRSSKIECLPQFANIFQETFGKSLAFDNMLLRSAMLFDIDQLLDLIKTCKFTKETFKDVAVAHLKKISCELFLGAKGGKICDDVRTAIQEVITYEKKFPVRDRELTAICSTWLSLNKKKLIVETLPSAIEQLYNSFPKDTNDRCLLILTAKIVSIVLVDAQIGDLSLYPDAAVLDPLRLFSPDQVVSVQTAEDMGKVVDTLQQFPDRGIVCIAGEHTIRNLQEFSMLKRPLASALFYEAEKYDADLQLIKNRIQVLHTTLNATASPFLFRITSKPWSILQKLENIHSTKPHQTSSVFPLPAQVVLPFQGFPNKNNTCFINAGLQALLCLPKFQEMLKRPLPKEEKYEKLQVLHKGLNELMALRETQNELTAPLGLVLQELFTHVPDIKGQLGVFHDVTPVLEALLETINYPLQWDETYRGMDKYQHLSSTTRRPLYVLPVPMKANEPLQTLINEALSVEEVHDQENKWKATTIDAEEIALADYTSHHTLVEPLPDFIIIQLKRWKWEKEVSDFIKDTASIQIDPIVKIGASNFSLKACIHQNHLLFHYHAETKVKEKWYRCDDTAIGEIEQPDPANAYIFVLEKIA